MFVLTIIASLAAAFPAIHEMSSEQISEFQVHLTGAEPDYGKRVAAVACRTLGTPYADGPLGEGPGGKHDTDPLIDHTRVDCVTFVEQTLALAATKSYGEATALLQRIRYRGGKVSFETRNHFMVADWLENNHSFCRELTSDLGVPAERVTRRISRKGFFKRVDAPELGQDTPDRDVEITYIPAAEAGAAAVRMPSPSLVVFVGRIDWLFALHCGFFIRSEQGVGLLYHASSKGGKVLAQPFAEYAASSSRYLGFTVHALSDPSAASPREGNPP